MRCPGRSFLWSLCWVLMDVAVASGPSSWKVMEPRPSRLGLWWARQRNLFREKKVEQNHKQRAIEREAQRRPGWFYFQVSELGPVMPNCASLELCEWWPLALNSYNTLSSLSLEPACKNLCLQPQKGWLETVLWKESEFLFNSESFWKMLLLFPRTLLCPPLLPFQWKRADWKNVSGER
jgi:hypothetical protein